MASISALSDSEAYQGTEAAQDKPVDLDTLIGYLDSENVAGDLPDGVLAEIGDRCKREYEVDVNSRADWTERMDAAMEVAMQVVQKKNHPWPNAANIKFPLVTTAAIQFAARAYPAIVDSRNVVKATVNGNDDGQMKMGPDGQPVMDPEGNPEWIVPPNAKRQRADRISRHMSWQCLEEMEEWEEDTDNLLHILPVIGCLFRKTWFDPVMGRNRSEMVTAKNLVVNYWAKSLDTAPRVTQVFELYPHEILERVRAGLYLDVELGLPNGTDSNDDDAPHRFLEQHRLLDLDNDKYPEPYVVTVHEDTGKVVRILPRFDEDSIEVNDAGEVSKINSVQYFTKFSFLPNPEGGFYGIGFGWLLHPLNETINSAINQMMDAGTQQITGGGFIGAGLRIKGGSTRFKLGEYKRVTVTGSSVRENVVPLQFQGPNATMFNLLGLLIEAARDITSVKDVMTGDEGPAGEAASRTLARIEQGMKVFSAIYKRIFRSLKQEYRKLYELNALYLPPKQYFTLMDEPEAVQQSDYEGDSLDISPAADPAMITDMQRLARADFLREFAQDPYFNQMEVRKRILTAASIEEPDELLVKEVPPDPNMAADADRIELEKASLEQKTQAETAKIEAGREKLEADREQFDRDMQEKARIADEANAVVRERIKADIYRAELDRQTKLELAGKEVEPAAQTEEMKRRLMEIDAEAAARRADEEVAIKAEAAKAEQARKDAIAQEEISLKRAESEQRMKLAGDAARAPKPEKDAKPPEPAKPQTVEVKLGDDIARALAPIADSLKDAAESIQDAADKSNRPKRIVYDKDGKPTGTESVDDD